MKLVRRITKGLGLLLLLAGVGLNCTRVSHKTPTATTTTVLKKGDGPPPHAPAHGYRARTSEGIEIAYDSKLGLYVVVGLSNHYFCEGLYYRFNGGHWEVTAKFHDSWEAVAEYKVPQVLYSSKKGKGKGKHKGKRYGAKDN